MKRILAVSIISIFIIFVSIKADARVIKQGTITGSISAFNETRKFDQAADSNEYSVSVSGGYFFVDNLEFDAALSYDNYSSDPQDSTTYSISPLVHYHVSINDASDFYAGVGGLLTSRKIERSSGKDTRDDSAGFTIRAGWEYFFNDNVALDIGLSYSRVTWDLSGYSVSSDTENRFYWPRIGFRLFF